MNGFIFRVTAYHGEPIIMNGTGVHARSGLSIDTPVSSERVINDPNDPTIKDVGHGGIESDYDVGALIEDFEDEYGCKVNYDFDLEGSESPGVFQFDVFEPSWPDEDEAKDLIDDLSERLKDWAEGFPTGR